MLGPVTAQVVHVGVDIAEGDRADQLQIQIVNGDLVQLGRARRLALDNLDVAKEVAQV